jgi:hypothetical protein
MEKEAPGGENSQIAAALAAGADRASFCKKLPGAGDPNSDALQTRVAPNITITIIKILAEYIVKDETRFSVLAKSRKLVRTRSATLPPFHFDEGPKSNCSVLPHSAASGAPPKILPPRYGYRQPAAAPTYACCELRI